MYQTILFDLDGTLTDPGEGITNSVAYALEKYGIKVKDRTELYKFIGPPLLDSFMEFYGFTEEQAREAIVFYRQYFTTKGMFENQVYEGITELLENLKKAGKRLIVATSKPYEFSVEILKHFDLLKYFDYVSGATLDETRSAKGDIIQYALRQNELENISEIVMVGDRKHDVIGARQNGIDTIGVLYGYGSKKELEEAGAKYLASFPQEVFRYV